MLDRQEWLFRECLKVMENAQSATSKQLVIELVKVRLGRQWWTGSNSATPKIISPIIEEK